MGVEVGGFEVVEAPVGAVSSIPTSLENGKVEVAVNGSIKFGSHGDEPAKLEAGNVSDGPKDAVNEWPAPRQVHSFYFIRYRLFDDIKLKAKKELIEKEVEKKSQARFQITEKIRAKKVSYGFNCLIFDAFAVTNSDFCLPEGSLSQVLGISCPHI